MRRKSVVIIISSMVVVDSVYCVVNARVLTHAYTCARSSFHTRLHLCSYFLPHTRTLVLVPPSTHAYTSSFHTRLHVCSHSAHEVEVKHDSMLKHKVDVAQYLATHKGEVPEEVASHVHVPHVTPEE